jgi:hypothetical protein
LSAPFVLATTPLTVAVPALPKLPLVAPPPLPPVASSVTFNALAAAEYGVPLVPSTEVALPPAPATPVSVDPPEPPAALCVKDKDPVVPPETAFVTLSLAPAPPAAPE